MFSYSINYTILATYLKHFSDQDIISPIKINVSICYNTMDIIIRGCIDMRKFVVYLAWSVCSFYN